MDYLHPMSISYENASGALVRSLPELSLAYQAEVSWWNGEQPGPHLVYGNVLNPYIDRLLQSDDKVALGRVFAFLELLSNSQDLRVQELVAVTVCEHLGDDRQKLTQARRFMGSATLKISKEVEEFWNK